MYLWFIAKTLPVNEPKLTETLRIDNQQPELTERPSIEESARNVITDRTTGASANVVFG